MDDTKEEFEAFFRQAERAVAMFSAWARLYRIPATADHICYKCGSTKQFEAFRAMLERPRSFIYQSFISQRRIAIIKFVQPLPSQLGPIRFLELSDQKPDGSQRGGFEHVEIYPSDKAMTMADLAAELEEQGAEFTKVVRPHHTTYDTPVNRGFLVRLEDEPLVTKIAREEFR